MKGAGMIGPNEMDCYPVCVAFDRGVCVFSFPRLAKKYKGDTIPSFLLPRNMHKAKKNCSGKLN